ncbi:DNA-3-methyladenine glycosylase family protein [Paenibacillus sp. sgz500958]|uniref:DNA-3-methyladenine glycosylase family protein n=1 Tax=Paenibacillus sp. sgz500958 TaxID=3242475 RepID=UPI0036D3A13D
MNTEIKMIVPREFSFAENLNYFERSPNECLYRIEDQRIYKALEIGNQIVVIELSGNSPGYLTIRFLGDTAPHSDIAREEVTAYVREWLDLDRDLTPFYALAESDVLLKQATDSLYGLRIIGIPDLFEALCWGIIGQQINLAFAYTLKRRLVEHLGTRVECEGKEYWIFPAAETIAALTVEDLEPIRLTVKKSEYLIGVARLIANGELTKESLMNTGSIKEAERMLISIRGIGPWTANYVLMRCLRMTAAFPIDDVGLHNVLKMMLKLDRKPTRAEIIEVSAGWGGWEAYATFYLWRMLY